MSEATLELRHIDRTYVDEDPAAATVVEALKDINLTIGHGEFVSIIGASGCGKTTLLRLIGGLDQPQGGQVLLGGVPITGPDPQRGTCSSRAACFRG